ncbi:MAG: dephospho-CoA kinase, partial [Proteobacteria bacterium]|nr:dephospho-CoA kinase [Pseudomonadota bacterium]
LVAPGQPALTEIVAAFGPEALTPNGQLDRQRMRERIFADANARRRLESILHPRVRDALRERARECTAAYCLLAIPLFAESSAAYAWVDRVLVVDVPPAVQLARLMQRDGMTRESSQRALAAQASRSQRLALADDVIDNSGTPAVLAHIIARLHHRYSRLSGREKF